MNILVVDDSVVFRRQVSEALEGYHEFNVVSVAQNGAIALKKLDHYKIDVMIIDLEMPVMNGIETIKNLSGRENRPKIIVFTSDTMRGAGNAINALELGADDFALKPQNKELSIAGISKAIQDEIVPKLRQFLDSDETASVPLAPQESELKADPLGNPFFQPTVKVDKSRWINREIKNFRPHALVIASSTGGPAALETLLSGLPLCPVPIFIAQHMPPLFTFQLATRINNFTENTVCEAKQFQIVSPEHIYIAPGDFHMLVEDNGAGINKIKLNQNEKRNYVRPAADFTFESCIKIFGSNLLGIVLTGMGKDGCDGAIAIKNAGGGIMIQDKESSTVWGMPGSVHESGAYDMIGSLDKLKETLHAIIKIL